MRETPRTEAGRRLFTDVDPGDMWESTITVEDILIVEAEMRRTVLDEVEARVRALDLYSSYSATQVAVLDLIADLR